MFNGRSVGAISVEPFTRGQLVEAGGTEERALEAATVAMACAVDEWTGEVKLWFLSSRAHPGFRFRAVLRVAKEPHVQDEGALLSCTPTM